MAYKREPDESSWLSRIPWQKSLFLFVLGLVLLVIYVAFANLTQVIQILVAADPKLVGLAIMVIIIGSFFYAIAWQKLLNRMELQTSFFRTLYYAYIGMFFDIIIPIGGTAGIAVRSYLIKEDQTKKNFIEKDIWGRALTSQTAMKICVTMWIVISGILGFMYLFLRFSLPRYTMIAMGFFLSVSIIGSIALILLSTHPDAPTRLAHGLLNVAKRAFPFIKSRIEELRPRAVENARSFSNGMRVLIREKTILIYILIFTLLYYLSFIMAAWLSFVALGLRQSVLVICAISTVALIIEFLGWGLPGGIGVKEIVTAEIFVVVIGTSRLSNEIAPRAVAAAASIMVNILMFWIPLVLNAVFAFKALPILRKAWKSMIEIQEQDFPM
ncbi:MAG: YbhN family protein [Candidatus Heimdallarchaeota archaeon]